MESSRTLLSLYLETERPRKTNVGEKREVGPRPVAPRRGTLPASVDAVPVALPLALSAVVTATGKPTLPWHSFGGGY